MPGTVGAQPAVTSGGSAILQTRIGCEPCTLKNISLDVLNLQGQET